MKNLSQYLGIVLGGLYGLACRVFFEHDIFKVGFNVFSVSFVWIVPVIIAIIPILFTNEKVMKSKNKQFFFPIIAEFTFFVFALSSGLEDWLCILIFSFPYILAAGIVGLLSGKLIKMKRSKKMYSIIFLPFLLQPIESYFDNKTESYTVSSNVEIQLHRSEIWDNIIEVPEITEEEYTVGFFYYLGVPRPIKSELKIIDGIEYRIGYFTQNLTLFETISYQDKYE